MIHRLPNTYNLIQLSSRKTIRQKAVSNEWERLNWGNEANAT